MCTKRCRSCIQLQHMLPSYISKFKLPDCLSTQLKKETPQIFYFFPMITYTSIPLFHRTLNHHHHTTKIHQTKTSILQHHDSTQTLDRTLTTINQKLQSKTGGKDLHLSIGREPTRLATGAEGLGLFTQVEQALGVHPLH